MIDRKPSDVKDNKKSGEGDNKPEEKKKKEKEKVAEVAYKAPFDFKTLLKNEKLANSVEYPFSNVHIED